MISGGADCLVSALRLRLSSLLPFFAVFSRLHQMENPLSFFAVFLSFALFTGPVLGRFDRLDQIGPRTLRGPALVGVPFCTVRYKIGESANIYIDERLNQIDENIDERLKRYKIGERLNRCIISMNLFYFLLN